MRHTTLLSGIICLLCLLAACGDSHFMTDASYRSRVERDFQQKKALMPQGDLFAIFETSLSDYEREALEFLYAYMPLADIADYSGEFHLMNVRASRQAADEMPWGKRIPEDLFRHFVLPVRVNNEHLDSARVVFYKELKDRVKTLSLQDAILEVNHWCHEKAIYTPSDARTSSPLATVRTAYGRCGEESTFLVAALRSVGIPARQVYTPRWAHTDDNHAWVEAWADGKWYFLGACEPEPVLNLGWFNAPASRGMLMHTKVFGRYEGAEEVMSVTPTYTEINVIGNYAPTAKASVTVVDASGVPVDSACVEFKLYNYAEFYTVATKYTSASGICGLTAGKGDMLVWASKDGHFGFARLSFGKQSELTVKLDKKEGDAFAIDMDIVPPSETANLPEVTPEQRAENDRRLAQEDSIRNAYVASFPTEEKAKAFAEGLKLDVNQTSTYILKSRGNHADIMQFLSNAAEKGQGARALELLSTLADKDLRDTPCSILEDHLYATDAKADVKEVLAPRIATEMLTPYRTYLQKALSAELAAQIKADPQVLMKWCKDSLSIRNDLSTIFTITSPEGVWRSRVTDSQSRDIFFVAAARSLGIPAWKDEVNGNICYRLNGKPVLVDFESSEGGSLSEGVLKATYQAIPRLDNPKYYTHFTLSKYDNGTFQLQNHPEDASWASLLKNGSSMSTGYYMMVTGSRMANGGVLIQVSFFSVDKGKTTVTPLCMRNNTEEVRVIGSFNSEALYTRPGTDEQVSVLNTTGRGYYIVGVLGVGQEPTNHALKDIEVKKAEFEKWGRTIVLLFTDEAAYKKFDRKEFPNLPSNVVFGIDKDGSILKMIAENMKLGSKPTLPVIILGDTFNRVVFESHGYTIGMGEQLLHVIHGL